MESTVIDQWLGREREHGKQCDRPVDGYRKVSMLHNYTHSKEQRNSHHT